MDCARCKKRFLEGLLVVNGERCVEIRAGLAFIVRFFDKHDQNIKKDEMEKFLKKKNN